MARVKIKSGDTAIEFTDTLTKDSVAVDLTGISAVVFLLELADAPYTRVSLTAAVDGDATLGNVKYTVGTGFPTTVGEYRQEWQVTMSDATILTFPSNSYNVVQILSDLN